MGEEAKQQEEAKVDAKPEEKAEEKKEEKKEEKQEEKKEEEPKPPSPLILYVDLHCDGCAKKVERSIMKIRGVEGVEIDMDKNQVTIKGVVEPEAVCNRITRKTKRRVKVISPLPPAEGEPLPQVVTSQVSGIVTVELNVNMHCEACAEQLKKKILKMRGVQTAATELSSGKVMVTGTMDPNKLVDYVYRRTKKQAKIIPQPEPEKQEEKKEGSEPAEEAKPEEKKDENNGGEKKEEEKPQEEKKEGEGNEKPDNGTEEKAEEAKMEGEEVENVAFYDDDGMRRMMYYYQPLYIIERPPPAPQLFSDENPNACCVS
ncbi:heavy metal-associated isoprenylated plant protein 9-like isoform X1 [Syzygium oleosum]|uniref:heavy metal-associated isoprenylated plant protein 9-like isoform X1 n=1 Tax=Syzygium oleosum TaxID=219896 RepID=UPI0011D26A36|nr:heavy metal-associated isoprenylated plant protein 9-like isoform X1 [Syzygium oleosum]XP_056163060.1 heavy metal-associated isoprenylated plant protein 9-like isoform X1 [Syzygium oleosum]